MTRLKLSLTTSRVQILVYSGHRKRRRFSSVGGLGLGVVHCGLNFDSRSVIVSATAAWTAREHLKNVLVFVSFFELS